MILRMLYHSAPQASPPPTTAGGAGTARGDCKAEATVPPHTMQHKQCCASRQKAIPVSLPMHSCVCFQWLRAALFAVMSCKAGRAMSPGWWRGENVCGQLPPCTAAAVGDNGAWQSCALLANAVSIRKGLSNLGQPKADPQAGEEEEGLQHGCSSGIGRVCRSLCGMSTGRLWPCSSTCNFTSMESHSGSP